MTRPPLPADMSDLVARGALSAIAKGEPDTKLSPHLQARVTDLVRRKWIMICGCSDGDYVALTKLGRKVFGG